LANLHGWQTADIGKLTLGEKPWYQKIDILTGFE